jgi:H+/Cl- antiporter ClcA
MKKIPWLLLAPVIIGIVGCFLPDARYILQGEKFTTQLTDSYSGWSALTILLVIGVITLLMYIRQKKLSPYVNGLTGVFLIGFALYRVWHTLSLFKGSDTVTLAGKMEATAFPREGILFILVAGCWLLFRAIRKT